ncbi:MAG: hypothetical protein LBD02_08125 [Christensenellaceae bacterium]|jgi:hypothetical protein|nr:hypothetical protein [Christensenellaceae bacterium]
MEVMWNKLKGGRGFPLLAALCALGILLLAASYFLPKSLGAGALAGTPGETELEERLCGVLRQIEGVGRVRVLIHEGGGDEIVGVLVVAEGAQELSVRTELMRAAMTALNVPARAVEVFAMREIKEEVQ